MLTRSLLTIALVSILAACGGDAVAGTAGAEAAGGSAAAATTAAVDCPPLQVKIDGKPVDGLVHALGVLEAGSYGVEVFNHDQVTCEQVLSGARSIPPGEIDVRAYVDERGSMASVSIGSKTNFAQGVELARKPAKEGDPIAICVSNVKWVGGGGAGSTYEVNGLFQGPYCGQR
jgi:hypothetical protein